MTRSQVNALLRRATAFCDRMNFHLPPFAFWSPEDWVRAGHEFDEIRDNQLGWDITDCEKLLIVEENQRTPFHYHVAKMEDIICRAGGDLLVQVHNAAPDGTLADTPVQVNTDGRVYEVEAGSIIRLTPGESISIPAYLTHEFWAAPGTGTSLVGEVSKVNDDHHDNFFLGEVGRFPTIEEDEPPLHLLCTEYPPAP